MLPDAILKGMRIVEASAFVAAPLGGMTLAQLGAEVIRIDPLAGGLDYRRWPVTADNTSLFWCGLNKSKKSVTLDLSSAEGRELAAALVTAPGPDAGILLTNFPPRGFLDYEALSARRADLIQLTITGDRHGRSAVDYTVNPRVGIPYLTGSGTADEVCNHVLPAWDLVTGNLAALGILAAERSRRQTGVGQHVKLALEDAALAVMGHLGFLAEAQLGNQRERAGNDLFGAFGRDFVTADGQRIMIVGLTTKQWKSLCAATGLAGDVDVLGKTLDLDLQREGERFIARAQLAALFAPWIAARTLADVASAFDAHAVCWSRYQTVRELVATDPECSLANPLFSAVVQPGVGELLAPGSPLAFSAFPRASARPAPRLGEHTEQVLTDVLGLSSAQLGALIDRKIAGR
ncbi:CoA transferase [Paraburkholderia sp.]|uniref:CoA transferase n=1 Tax=Paraburkholderia sp. TaxID=1926495 RepID=UPI002D300E7C|nr:CoA transferase [Paraburkholderia sp.]HZZ02326.1 CoA transferase [Paraburkholderia sp.]